MTLAARRPAAAVRCQICFPHENGGANGIFSSVFCTYRHLSIELWPQHSDDDKILD